MKYIYNLLIISSIAFFASCSEDETYYETFYSLTGNTYENQGLSLYFESTDSVSFRCLHPGDENVTGKAAYRLNGALLYIKNPYGYGGRPDPEEVTEPYFFNFWGIVKADRLENVSFFFIGPHEQIQYMGNDGTFYLIKDK